MNPLVRSSLAFACLGGLLATARAAQEVPELTGRIVDRAGVISDEVEAELDAELAAFEARTTHQIAVLTVPSLEGRSIEGYSIDVARAWGLGGAEANDGVLLLVVTGDRETRLEVGTGLEGLLTDLKSGRILRDVMRPHLSAGDHDAGVRAGVEAIMTVLDGGELDLPTAPSPSSGISPLLRVVISLALLLVLALLSFVALVMGQGRQFALFLPVCNPLAVATGFAMGIPLAFWLGYFLTYMLVCLYLDLWPQGRYLHGRVAARFRLSAAAGGSSSGGWSAGSSDTDWSSSSESDFTGGGGDFAGGGASDRY